VAQYVANLLPGRRAAARAWLGVVALHIRWGCARVCKCFAPPAGQEKARRSVNEAQLHSCLAAVTSDFLVPMLRYAADGSSLDIIRHPVLYCHVSPAPASTVAVHPLLNLLT
jgi:hypothetical protein